MQLLHFCSDYFLYFYNVTVRITYPFLWQSRGFIASQSACLCGNLSFKIYSDLSKERLPRGYAFCNN